MQHPVRYYISQTDDQPVVRSVPVVATRPNDAAGHVVTTQPTAAAAEPSAVRRTRVRRLVRAAIHRDLARR